MCCTLGHAHQRVPVIHAVLHSEHTKADMTLELSFILWDSVLFVKFIFNCHGTGQYIDNELQKLEADLAKNEIMITNLYFGETDLLSSFQHFVDHYFNSGVERIISYIFLILNKSRKNTK